MSFCEFNYLLVRMQMLRWMTIGSQLNNPIKNPAAIALSHIFSSIIYYQLLNSRIFKLPSSLFLWIFIFPANEEKRICKIFTFFLTTLCRPLYSWNVRIFCQMFQTWSLKPFNAYLTQIYWISDNLLDTKLLAIRIK